MIGRTSDKTHVTPLRKASRQKIRPVDPTYTLHSIPPALAGDERSEAQRQQ